jgi:hypothetical protein
MHKKPLIVFVLHDTTKEFTNISKSCFNVDTETMMDFEV